MFRANKKYFQKVYGCAMNVSDSNKLAAVLEAAGYQNIRPPEGDNQSSDIRGLEECDIILVNTCVVRQHAEERAAGFITSLSGLKQKNPNIIIGVCGCYVTEPGRDVKKHFPHVDWFIPPNGAGRLAELLQPLTPFSPSPLLRGKGIGERGEVVITHGCDNFCSYCVVPYVRGREVSRPMEEVLAEIKGLIQQGITDITLLGQNVNSYKYGLANLFRAIGDLALSTQWRGGTPTNVGVGEVVIRFLTSHPKDMSDEIIETVANLPYVAKEFMVPLQSGDDEILHKMNRGYSLHYYIERVNRIRALMPGARIATDILVGFPGESEEQFQNTLRAIERIKFNEVHMFAYSARPETAAARLPDQLTAEVKVRRLHKLIDVVRGGDACYNIPAEGK